MDYIECVPAYGADYKSQYAVVNAWNAGKDFQIASVEHPDRGRYVNKADAPKGATMMLRYRALTRVTPIKVK